MQCVIDYLYQSQAVQCNILMTSNDLDHAIRFLDQNIKFAIQFIIFLSGLILLSILFVLIDQINSLLPNGRVGVSWGVIIDRWCYVWLF